MIRFFCRVCNTVKRAHRMPVTVLNPLHIDPTMRVGECRWHVVKRTGKVSHREFLGHKPAHRAPVFKATKASAPHRPKKTRRHTSPGEESAA